MSARAGQPALAEQTLRPTAVQRAEVEDLLYREAALLDDWKIDEWLELWTMECTYVIPTNDNPDADPDNDLMYVNHDRRLLEGLGTRLKSTHAHREYPWSKTRHLVTNVRVLGEDEDGAIHATAGFIVWRFRNKDVDSYVGSYRIQCVASGTKLLLQSKVVILDAWTLAPYGAISIVL